VQPRESFELEDEPTARSKKKLCDFINEEYIDECYERQSRCRLEDIKHKEHLIITFSASILVSSGPSQELLRLRVVALETYNFVMFEQKSRSSYDNFGSGSVVAFSEDSAQTIYNSARSRITTWLDAEDPSTVATIDSLHLYEVGGGIQNLCSALHERFAAEG